MSIRQTVTITILITLMLGLLPLAGCGGVDIRMPADGSNQIDAQLPPADDDGVDTTQHLGRWTGTEPETGEELTFEFREGGILVMIIEPITLEGSYTIDYTTTPTQITMTLRFFDEEDTLYGIVEFVDANTMRIAAGDDTADSRPASFADAAEHDIVEFNRQ